MLIPKRKRVLNKAYIKKVKELGCCGCGRMGVDAHHKTGAGMGLKEDDNLTMPLCRVCHDRLHHDPKEWEKNYGAQDFHIRITQKVIKQRELDKGWYES